MIRFDVDREGLSALSSAVLGTATALTGLGLRPAVPCGSLALDAALAEFAAAADRAAVEIGGALHAHGTEAMNAVAFYEILDRAIAASK